MKSRMNPGRDPIPSETPPPKTSWHSYISKLFFWGTAAAMVLRFYWIAIKYAVNLFYYDEWVTYASLFETQPWWRIFVAEHGPHRQGLGVLVVSKLLSVTHWDSRVQAFSVGVVIVLAMILATYLKIQTFGPISGWDIAIPIMFLGLGQWEVILGATGTSPEAFPLILLVAYCLAWSEGRGLFRNFLVLLINFLLIFTGFGIFMAGITLLLFGLQAYHRTKARNRRQATTAMLSLGIATTSLASFFHGYQFNPAVECYHFPYRNPAAYPVFMGMMFARFLGAKQGVILASILGIAVIAIASSLLLKHLRTLCEDSFPDRASLLIVILLGFSLTFSAATAVGRVCLGLEGARASRYLTLLIPAFLGIYFCILAVRSKRTRSWLAGIFVLALLPSGLQRNHKEIESFSAHKQSWKQCYLAQEDIRFCDAETNFQLYPCPECIQMKQRLEFLKRNRLNLYADSK